MESELKRLRGHDVGLTVEERMADQELRERQAYVEWYLSEFGVVADGRAFEGWNWRIFRRGP